MTEVTRQIPLTQGKFATVDAIDFEWINQWKWTAHKSPQAEGYYWRAVRCTYPEYKILYMQNVLAERMGLPKAKYYDHKNNDALCNTRENIRPCTASQNGANKRKKKGTSSVYKGVTWSKSANKWLAQIRVQYEHYYLGCFASEIEAAAVYAAFAIYFWGEFACFD